MIHLLKARCFGGFRHRWIILPSLLTSVALVQEVGVGGYFNVGATGFAREAPSKRSKDTGY